MTLYTFVKISMTLTTKFKFKFRQHNQRKGKPDTWRKYSR